MRQKGKVAELALGYQGGPNALIKMGALDKGLKEEELPGIVNLWRKSSPKIVRLWNDVEECAINAVEEPETRIRLRNLSFICRNDRLIITLPSKRDLMYYRPTVQGMRPYHKLKLQYQGISGETKQWELQDTYGGKLVENIVQAIARDCLAEAMLRLQAYGYNIVMHVHDEVICELQDSDTGSIADMNAIMSQALPWAPTLKLTAAGFETRIYKKD
jgi:DNA polymerase